MINNTDAKLDEDILKGPIIIHLFAPFTEAPIKDVIISCYW